MSKQEYEYDSKIKLKYSQFGKLKFASPEVIYKAFTTCQKVIFKILYCFCSLPALPNQFHSSDDALSWIQ